MARAREEKQGEEEGKEDVSVPDPSSRSFSPFLPVNPLLETAP
jgi:hypothetical protein